MKNKKYYYCEGYSGWFVCLAESIQEARRCLKNEIGTEKIVRRATNKEVGEYCLIKGYKDEFQLSI